MRVKTIALLYILLFLINTSIHSQWVWQNPLPQGNNLNSVFFINANSGWAAGNNGTILMTSDQGNLWTTVQSQTSAAISKIYFINLNCGFALSDSGRIFITTNGGSNWFQKALNANIKSNDILFTSQYTGYICGFDPSLYRGVIYKTTDAGNNWSLNFTPNSGYNFTRVGFLDSNKGYVSGTSSVTYFTTDAGNNWSVRYFSFADYCFIDSNNFLIIDGSNYIYRTTNGGQNFSSVYAYNSYLHSFHKINSNLIYVVSYNGAVLKSTNAGINWSIQSAPVTTDYKSASFLDSSTGYITGKNGMILKTINGGINWSSYNLLPSFNLLKCTFFDQNTGWVSGEKIISKTTNGGNNWFSIWTDSNSTFRTFSFLNELTGWTIKAQFSANPIFTDIYKTTNGGINWQFLTGITIPPPVSGDFNLYQIQFINDSLGWFCGTVNEHYGSNSWDNGIIGKSINGGSNWIFTNFSNTLYVNDIKFSNINTGWAVGSNNGIFKSTNSGNSWTNLQGAYSIQMHYVSVFPFDTNTVYLLGYSGSYYNNNNAYLSKTTNGGINWTGQMVYNGYSCYKMFFFNLNTGWISGSSGTLFATSNGGLNWHKQQIPTNNDIWSPFFIDQNTGWIAGNNGTILKTTTGIISGIKESENNISSGFELNQNFPNPFNAVTKIEFYIPKRSNVIITVYDILGKKIKTLLNNNLNVGSHGIYFDASYYASGIYFYQLAINNEQLAIKKMVLIK